MEGCGQSFIKFCVFFCNFLVFVVGVVIFGVSLAAALNTDVKNYLQELIDNAHIAKDTQLDNYQGALWLLVAIGVFLACVGFLGCCGAWCENRCLLGVFFCVLLGLAVIELIGAIVVLTKQGKIEDEVKSVINESFEDAKTSKNASLVKSVNDLQDDFKCCGVNGTELDPVMPCKDDWIGKNCVDTMWELVWDGFKVAGIVAIVAIVVEILAMVFSCFLCQAIGKQQGYEQYA